MLGPGILGSAKSLVDALHGLKEVNVKTDVEKFVAAKTRAGLSKRHLGTMRNLLELERKFGDRSLSSITVAEIEEHIAKVKGGTRTKNNVTATLKTFFLWAQKHDHLRHDRPPVTETLTKAREPGRTPEIFTIEEMGKILQAAEPEMVPYMAIGAFAGLWSAEIEKLDWSAIDFGTGFIKIAWEIDKTCQRRLIPISENLRAWLMTVKKDTGPIVPRNLRERIQAIGKVSQCIYVTLFMRDSIRNLLILAGRGMGSKRQGKFGAFATEALPGHPEPLDEDQLGVCRNAVLVEGDLGGGEFDRGRANMVVAVVDACKS